MEIPFGGSETRSMTDVVISVDQSQSMHNVQLALAKGIESMATALHEYPITYHIITPTAFIEPHLQGSGTWLYDAIYYRDDQDRLLFQIWDDKWKPASYANPFSTIREDSIQYFDGSGKRTNELNSTNELFKIKYSVETLPAIAKYAILQTDSYQKAIELSRQLAESVKLGAGGDSDEMSMCSMLKYVRDRITDPSSPEYRKNPLLALLNVSDEDSSEHVGRENSNASKCFESSEIEGYEQDSYNWVNLSECEANPEDCKLDNPKTQYSYRYFFPTLEATCSKIIDKVLTPGTYTSRAISNCFMNGRDLCDFEPDAPVPQTYSNSLDIAAAGARLGCVEGTVTGARVLNLNASNATSSFFEPHTEDRRSTPFIHNEKQYQDLKDFRKNSSSMKIHDLYARYSLRVQKDFKRIVRRHTFTYHNDKMKQTIESSSSSVRATMNDVVGEALMDLLEEKTTGYFYAGIVTKAEDVSQDSDASVGQSQIDLSQRIKEHGSFKSNSETYSVRNSDYASFMVPAMREFVTKFALSTYDLKLETDRQVVSIGIRDSEGNLTALDYTLDESQSTRHVALLKGGTLHFNLPLLQANLRIEVEPGKQLSQEHLEKFKIIVGTTTK